MISEKVVSNRFVFHYRYILVVGTFLLALLLYVDRILISVAKPGITEDLLLTDKQFGWVMSVFSLGYALFQIPGGYLADKFGARKVLAGIVAFWSLFTGLTAYAWNFTSLMIFRFLFGAGEAGAYPGINKIVFNWIPVQERGMVNGINFSAGRLGAAFALPLIAILIQMIGWQHSFVVLTVIGFSWATLWYFLFRDQPTEYASISREELDYILVNRQNENETDVKGSVGAFLIKSKSVWLLMIQYFASNFTFFFCLTWLLPYMKTKFDLDLVYASTLSSIPLIFGALGNLSAGFLVDKMYEKGFKFKSRTITAIIGFLSSGVGLIFSMQANTPIEATVFLSLAIFGADMTLSPSWASCSDIGGKFSGTVSSTMNMFGNLGAFLTALAFPYLLDWTGSYEPFFYIGAMLNMVAIMAWILLGSIKQTKIFN
jgi:ACS family glucarate transporter-like MFS transporter